MSGGHWQYCGFRIQTDLLVVAEDPDVAKRWPLVGAAIKAFGDWFYEAEHDMDYDLSGDTKEPDAPFDAARFGKLLDALLKVAPDEWFPRGKWATIQAVQARAAALPQSESCRQPGWHKSGACNCFKVTEGKEKTT